MDRQPRRTYLILALDLLLTIFCVSNIPLVVDRARFPAFTTLEGMRTVVVAVDREPGASLLHSGDAILEWYATPVGRPEHLEFLGDLSFIGETVQITVERNGSILTVPVVLVSFNASLRFALIYTLTGLVVFALALFLLLKRPHDPIALILHSALLALGAVILLTQGAIDASNPLSYARRAGLFTAYALTPAVFLQWTMLFPVRRFGRRRWPGVVLLGSAVGFAAALSWFHLTAMVDRTAQPFDTFQELYEWFHLYFFALIVAGLGFFLAGYSQESVPDRRAALRWIFWGILIGAGPFTLLVVLPQVFGPEIYLPEELGTVFALAIPLCLTVAFLRYHVFHVQVEVYRRLASAVVSLMTGAVAILACLIVASLIWEGAIFDDHFQMTLTIAVAVLAFQPARSALRRILEESLYPVRGSMAKVLQRTAERFHAAMTAEHLGTAVVNELTATLPGVQFSWARLEGVGLIVPQAENEPHPTVIPFPESVHTSLTPRVILARDSTILGARSHVSRPCIEWLVTHDADLALGVHDESGSLLAVVLGRIRHRRGPLSFDEAEAAVAITIQASESLGRLLLQERLFLEQQERRRSDELSRLKSHFVSSVSHDLRTPLTSITMFGEMLQDTRISTARRREYADIIVRESERLGRMVNNVLNFAKIERGTREYLLRETDLLQILRDAVRTMEAHAQLLKAVLTTKLPRRLPLVRGDADALHDVFVNLIGNALKYSTSKRWVRVEGSSEHDQIVVRVRDRGIGIPSDSIAKVFEPFYRVKDAQASQAGGAGLGLALVKHTIDAHGGTVHIESTAGKGTTVTISLPILLGKSEIIHSPPP